MHGRRMPTLSPDSWNAAFIHDSRHLLEGQMTAKFCKYGRELSSEFDRLRPILF